jgi:hypothetical protein
MITKQEIEDGELTHDHVFELLDEIEKLRANNQVLVDALEKISQDVHIGNGTCVRLADEALAKVQVKEATDEN